MLALTRECVLLLNDLVLARVELVYWETFLIQLGREVCAEYLLFLCHFSLGSGVFARFVALTR